MTLVAETEEVNLDNPVRVFSIGEHFLHLEDMRKLSRLCLRRYFQDKEMYCGGKIPDNLIYSENNVSLIMNTNMENGIKAAYDAIQIAGQFPPTDVDSSIVSDDIKLVMNILKRCSKVGIPKELAAGILLLHLEFCEGISI